MGQNLILPFAVGAGANVLTDTAYAETDVLAQGFQQGRAASIKFNKALRQSTSVASGFGQFTADYSGLDFVDSLTPFQMRDNFRIALAASTDGARYGVDDGQPNALVVNLTPAPPTLSSSIFIPFWVKVANTNNGGSTLNLNDFGTKTIVRRDGSSLQAGDLVAGRIYHFLYDGAQFQLQRGSAEGTSTSTGATAILGALSGLAPTAFGSTISISKGAAADSTGASYQAFPSPLTFALSNGNALNGFQGGTSFPASSTIHMFAVWGSTLSGCFASTSLMPALPANITYYRRIFSFTTDSSGNPLPYTVYATSGSGLLCRLTTSVKDANYLPLSTTRSLITTSVPQGLSMRWIGGAVIQGSVTYSGLLMYRVLSPGEPDVPLPAGSAQPVGPIPDAWANTSGLPGGTEVGDRPRITNVSGQIAAIANQPFTGLTIVTDGWIDDRAV